MPVLQCRQQDTLAHRCLTRTTLGEVSLEGWSFRLVSPSAHCACLQVMELCSGGELFDSCACLQVMELCSGGELFDSCACLQVMELCPAGMHSCQTARPQSTAPSPAGMHSCQTARPQSTAPSSGGELFDRIVARGHYT